MLLLTWKDAGFTEGDGVREVKGYTVEIRNEHIRQWKEDPDGRFKLSPASDKAGCAEIGQFFPSL